MSAGRTGVGASLPLERILVLLDAQLVQRDVRADVVVGGGAPLRQRRHGVRKPHTEDGIRVREQVRRPPGAAGRPERLHALAQQHQEALRPRLPVAGGV